MNSQYCNFTLRKTTHRPQTLTVNPLVVSSKRVTFTSKDETSISSSVLKYVDI